MREKGPQLDFVQFNKDSDVAEKLNPEDKENEENQPPEAEIPGDPFGREDPRYRYTDRFKDSRYG